jgi:hypothetical protein
LRSIIGIGPALLESLAKLGGHVGLLGEQLEARGDDLVHVGACQRSGEWAVPPRPVEHRLHEGSNGQRVARRDEMDRGPHEADRPNGAPLGDELRELVGPKALDARPERRIWIGRDLRLHADEPLDDLDRRQLDTTKQHLSREK